MVMARAVRWARDNALRLGADPTRLLLCGHSAGAHLAAIIATDPRFLQAVGMWNRVEYNVIHSGPRSGATYNDHFGGGDRFDGNLMFDAVRETSDQ